MNAAQYARYSTDNQRQTSIEDQHRNNRERAEREGLQVDEAHVYADGEVSAFTPIEKRPGSGRLMRDAAAGLWQVLIIEALDRFSRKLSDQERMVERLEFLGIRIIGIADGYDSRLEGREMNRQVRGSFNEQYIRDIGKKTHRGLDGQVARGYHAGGLSYGYRSTVAGVDHKGEPIGHRLEVDLQAADQVRWIFERYAEGWSCQRIAHDLNRRGVPAPRGKTWAVSALYGSPAKGSGVLNNRLYIGEYVWNRSRWLKNPDTGKRARRDRPEVEWKIARRPELAIVPPELWAEVRARMDRPRLAGGSRGRGQRPRTLFGGLVVCGACGGAVVAVSQRAYGCAARKDRGEHVCAGILVPRRQLDARLLSLVHDELLSAEVVASVQAGFARMLAAARLERDRTAARARARRAELDREISNLVDAVAASGLSSALRARLQAAEAERDALGAAAAQPPPQPLPAVQAAYRRLVADLQGALERDVTRAREMLQDALGPIRLVREGEEVWAEVETRPARLLMAGGASLGVVAGTCFSTQKRIRVR